MLQSFVISILSLLFLTSFTRAQDDSNEPDPTYTACTNLPADAACGCIVNTANSTNQFSFLATVAVQCLTSVPFNPAIATSLVSYVNDTLQFQSTLSYLKNPPQSYQQPPSDLLAGIEQIQQNIDNGAYNNQYAFETSLQMLLMSAHESHLYVTGGISSVFNFAVLDGIVSVSVDGKQLPKLYLEDDLLAYYQGNTTVFPSPVSQINSQDATEWFSNFANTFSMGALDPHSAYNQALSSAVLDVLGSPSLIEGSTTLFPGDQITLTFENGTSLDPYPWIAYYNSPGDTGPLATPGDFFNFFVTGFYPASYNPPGGDNGGNSKRGVQLAVRGEEVDRDALQTRQDRSSGWDNLAYPIPDVAQSDLSTTGNGFLSGYFYNDTGLAVLSIPSFDQFDTGIDTFTQTVSLFLNQSKAAGLTKLVIDLQENTGGQTFLAVDTFKQLFPDTQPFLGSRLRANDLLNIAGEQLTDFWDSLDTTDPSYYTLATDDFVATDLINQATGQNFTSWQEFFGPVSANGDLFTATQQYNLSSFIYDVVAKGGNIQTAVFAYANNPSSSISPPYAAEDIILLTDSQCSSACALFVEMMTNDADVQTVVAGGLPVTGPMQAVGLTRGAALEATDALDGNIVFAQGLLQVADDPTANLLPNRSDEDVWIQAGGVNLRDQLRLNDPEPIQFKYLAADCRIFYTVDNFYNFTNLWHYAANAIWSDSSLCVDGSTGFTGTAQLPPPIPANLLNTGQSAAAALTGTQFIPLDINTQTQGSLHDGGAPGSTNAASNSVQACDTTKPHPCPGGKECIRQKLINSAKGIWSGICPSVGGTVSSRSGKVCSNCAKR